MDCDTQASGDTAKLTEEIKKMEAQVEADVAERKKAEAAVAAGQAAAANEIASPDKTTAKETFASAKSTQSVSSRSALEPPKRRRRRFARWSMEP